MADDDVPDPPLDNNEDADEPTSFLPPFANAENRELDSAVRNLEKNLERTEAELEETNDRLKIMEEHLKNVQQELKYTQGRVEAKGKEIETENHLNSLAEREMARIQKDITNLTSERGQLQEKINSLQNQIYKGNEKMDQFKLLMNWNQEELEQWAIARRQKEDDNDALNKYKRQDESKMKELQLALGKISEVVHAKRQELDSEVIETQAAQVQLDKAAEDFRKLHTERQDLIRQWDEAMEAMRHRDAAIQTASERFAAKKSELRELQTQLDELAKFLEMEVANNKEQDARIAFYDREVGKQRDVYQRELSRADEFQNQVELTKATLQKSAAELAMRTVESEAAKEELDLRRRRLDASRKKHDALKRRLETEFNQLDTLEAKVAELERMRAEDETRLAGLIKQGEMLKKEQFKRSQKLFELRTKERELISEISGCQGQNRNLANRISTLDEQVVRQRELLYNVEFQLQQMERKVARAQGARSDEETRAMNERIAKLTAALESVNAEHSMLLDQVKHAEEELLRARRTNTGLRSEKSTLDESMTTSKLENEMIGRQLKAVVEQKEKAMVDHDVMRLEVKRLRDILAIHADEVFSLENRRYQLKASMEERRSEVEVHRDALRAEIRMLRDDVHRITLELKEREMKVEKQRAKHETMVSKHLGASEDGEEPKSQAYYVIKAAQEREELQREGDELDARIRKAERETEALKHTLEQLVNVNGAYNASFKKVNGKTSLNERAALREKLDRTYDKLKFKRDEEAALVGDIQQADGRLSNLQGEQRSLTSICDELERRRAEAARQVDDQQEKLNRAKNMRERMRNKLNLVPGQSPLALDLEILELRDTTRSMLQEIKVLALQNPDVGITDFFEAAGIKLPTSSLPSVASGRGDSRPGSHAGSGYASGPPSVRSNGSSTPRSPVSVRAGQPQSPVTSRPTSSRLAPGGASPRTGSAKSSTAARPASGRPLSGASR